MEENPAAGSSEGSGSGSGRQGRDNNLAQRFSRQISRTILPALRNLVRSNRSQRRASQQTEAEASSSNTITQPAPTSSPTTNSPTISPEIIENVNTTTVSSPPILIPLLSEPHALLNMPDPMIDPIPAPPSPPLLTPELTNSENAVQIVNSLGALTTLANSLRDAENAATTSTNPDDMDTSPSNTRQRYRLVVYFEERSPEEHPTARYVAVIVGRLDELQFLLSSSNTNERGFGDILNNLFNAYTPKGTPPATKSCIDSLPSITVTAEQQCMICLENFEEGATAVVLPCKHAFHGEECVKSWLKLHNSCPICRYELPVDDPEYEVQRKERMTARGFHEEDLHDHSSHSHSSDSEDVDMASSENDSVGWLFGGDESGEPRA